MRKLFLYIFSITLLASCQQKTNEEAVLGYAIEKQIGELDFALKSMRNYFDNYSRKRYNLQDSDQIDLRAINEADRITSWKQEYLRSGKDEHLLAYTDSVFSLYAGLYGKGREISVQIATLKKLINGKQGKATSLNLFYWALQAERQLVSHQAQMFGGICPAILPHPINLNKDNYLPGDTVFATFELKIHPDFIDSTHLNFDSLTVTHVPGNQKVERKVARVGQFVLLTIVPKKPGEYFIKGEVQVKSRRKQYFGKEFVRWGNKSFTVK